jgi:hypothetical protein
MISLLILVFRLTSRVFKWFLAIWVSKEYSACVTQWVQSCAACTGRVSAQDGHVFRKRWNITKVRKPVTSFVMESAWRGEGSSSRKARAAELSELGGTLCVEVKWVYWLLLNAKNWIYFWNVRTGAKPTFVCRL